MLEFFKYHSNGNDFIILDNRNKTFDKLILDSKSIQKLAKREFSIGADGVIFLQKSLGADFKMKIFNSDGTEADMCGNGLLCLVKYIYDFIEKKKSYSIETKAEVYKTFVDVNKVSFRSKLPKILKENIEINIDNKTFNLHLINSGVFHGVIFLSDIDSIDVCRLGKKIRYLKEFLPHGINVNFCEIVGDSKIRVRTYEKGVENETFCCSTGALAVAFSYLRSKDIKKLLFMQFRGGKIEVNKIEDELKLMNIPVLAYRGILESL